MMNLAKRISEKFEDHRLRLNVGGVVFETLRSTLRKRPGTRLSQLAEQLEADETWDLERQEYFFDRHPGVFSSILQCYRTDELHTEHNLCGNIIKHELDFWGLTELDIEPCCWGHYCRFMENKKTLAALDDNFTFQLQDSVNKPEGFHKFKRNMWIFLEDPSSSRGAKAYAIISMFFVLMSIAVFVLETHSWFRVLKNDYNGTVSTTVSAGYLGPSHCSCLIDDSTQDYINNSEPHEAMTYLDYLCAAFFTLEFLVRIFFAPDKLDFFKQPLNVIDLLCLVPHFVSIIVKTVSPSDNAGNILRIVLALRVIRVLRIFKLMKHYTAFKILVYTIKVSTKELLLLVVFLFSGVLIFASVMYFVEPETFNNIPIGFWWGIVTMTTVGYGDKVPHSIYGYLLGSVCVLCGVLTVAFTVPIVVNNFTLYYAHAQSRNQLPPQKKRELQQKLIMKNQKATEFIKKLAINVQHRRKTRHDVHRTEEEEDAEGEGGEAFTKLEDLKSPRAVTSRSSKDSGIDACVVGSPMESPKAVTRKDKLPVGMTEVDIDGGTCVGGGGGRGGGGGGGGRATTRIQTVSEIVPELEIPGSPDIGFAGNHQSNSKTPQMLETEQLLHELQDFDEKKREERRRQLERMHQRRDEVRARTTPRPPANVRSSRDSLKKK
ncbi:voltage-gated potassium channel KCNC1-like [Babylonia areolata]|uniref:voltage-gated potassium channel KCNC1-like n=1 Tax=Babylonia areolata TaxID=304850 RepID=UPI003FCFB3E5